MHVVPKNMSLAGRFGVAFWRPPGNKRQERPVFRVLSREPRGENLTAPSQKRPRAMGFTEPSASQVSASLWLRSDWARALALVRQFQLRSLELDVFSLSAATCALARKPSLEFLRLLFWGGVGTPMVWWDKRRRPKRRAAIYLGGQLQETPFWCGDKGTQPFGGCAVLLFSRETKGNHGFSECVFIF